MVGAGSRALVASPSFQLVRLYPGRLQLAQVDLFRLEGGTAVADLGLDELLDQGAVVVEWGDRLRASAPRLRIARLAGERRRLRREGGPAHWSW